jgi:transcriptional regulator with XRE-family HTH domain
MDTCERIKAARKKLALTQKELAEKAGVSLMSVRRYENDDKKYQLDILLKIAKALGVPLADLISSDMIFNLEFYEDLKQEAAEIELWKVVTSYGYSKILDSKTGDTWIKDFEGNQYLISNDNLSKFTNSIADFIKFQIQELIKGAEQSK